MKVLQPKKIIKTCGHCCDECQLFFCDFLRIEKYEVGFKRDPNNGYECIPIYKYIHYCDLFNGVEMEDGSLNICNKIYGNHYEGRP